MANFTFTFSALPPDFSQSTPGAYFYLRNALQAVDLFYLVFKPALVTLCQIRCPPVLSLQAITSLISQLVFLCR